MKPANIALFKQFLKEHGANKIFCGLYRQYPFPDNPTSVEEYLVKVDSDDVITSAFKFPSTLTNFGPDYWLDLAVKWESRKVAASESGVYMAISRERISKQAAKPLEMWDGPIFKTREKAKPAPPPVAPRPNVTEEQMALNGFKFFELSEFSNRRLKDGYISINTHKSWRISFNREVSSEIKKSGLKYLRVAQKDDEKALYIIFMKDDGLEWRENADNVCISRKQLVVRIVDFFGLEGAYNQLAISKNMAKTKDYLTYKITKISKSK
jgi:hypothetical protein